MMTQELGFSILTAPLAAMDRRALSQAWYSALHLVNESPATPKAAHALGKTTSSHAHHSTAGPRSPKRKNAAVPLWARRETVAPRGTAQVDRRARRSPLAREIERAFLRPVRSLQRATFSVDGYAGRVHVALQTSASGLHLIAVCSPKARAAVTRALEEARYALATRGVELSMTVKEA